MYRAAPASQHNAFALAPPRLAMSGGAIRTAALLSADALAVVSTAATTAHLFGAHLFGGGTIMSDWSVERGILPATIAAALFAILSGCHKRGTPWRRGARLAIQASLYAIGIEVLLGVMFANLADREPVFIALGVLPVLLATLNAVTRQILGRTGLWQIPVVLAGGTGTKLARDAGEDYRIAGRVGLDALGPGRHVSSIRALLAAHGAEGLLIAATGRGRSALVQDLADRAALEGVPVEIALPLERAAHNGVHCRATPGGLVLAFDPSIATATARLVKNVIDIVGAGILLTFFAPAMLLIATLIRRDGGPVLFVHRRIGLDGRPFGCLKFRTMVTDAQHCLDALLARDQAAAREWRETHKLRNDPRVTRLGLFLRRSSLDELPQLINVLRREMSLVGPRPIEDSETHHYGERIGYYCAVRPGITGLWQVSGRSNTSYERRVSLDVTYVTGWSLAADIGILLRTIPEVLRRQGAC